MSPFSRFVRSRSTAPLPPAECRPPGRTRRKPRVCRLAIEALEPRCLLAASGVISGSVLEDLTGNGISADDRPLANWSVRLFLDDGDGTFEPGTDRLVDQQRTRVNGRYDFRRLPSGTYFVQPDLPLGWAQAESEDGHDDPLLRPEDCGAVAAERNDTMATALATGLNSAQPGRFTACGTVGDNPRVADALDVDLFRFQLNAGDMVHIDVDAEPFGSTLDGVLRVFDAAGIQVASNEDPIGDGEDPHLEFVARTSGIYFVGVSGFGNGEYNPAVEESGNPGLSFSTGPYTIEIEVGPRAQAEPTVVTLGLNEQRSGVGLGVSRLGSITGQAFVDQDGDGVQDPGEPGLDGQLIILTHQGAFIAFTSTRSIDLNGDGRIDAAAESGIYTFDDLLPGVYFARALAAFGLGPAGVLQTSPSLERDEQPVISQVSTGPGSTPAPGLLPDLIVNPIDGLGDWFVTGGVLHFGQATPNIGLGPMELRAGEVLGDGSQVVYQRIYQDAGLTTFVDRPAGTFSFHPEHNHIHFDEYAEFVLRTALPDTTGDGVPEVGAPVIAAEKRSFCLIDVAPYDLTLPNAPAEDSGFGCGEVQRISVGWQDIYDPFTSGQQIDVSGLPPGEYWLEAVVDPDNRLFESNENNNVGRALIRIGAGAPDSPAGAHGFLVTSGEAVRDKDFGNFRLINISGQVFEDRDGDGRQDSNEHGLAGWTVFLDVNGDGVLNNPEGDGIASALAREPWAITDNHGNYLFQGIGPGAYPVRQVVQGGWIQTTSDPAPVAARSGTDAGGVNFGNTTSAGGGGQPGGAPSDPSLASALPDDGPPNEDSAGNTPLEPALLPLRSPVKDDLFWAALSETMQDDRKMKENVEPAEYLDEVFGIDMFGLVLAPA